MVHRHFQNPQTHARGAHLHLEIPAVSFFLHLELVERVAPEGAEGTHVGISNSIKQPQKNAGDSSGENLLEIHAARFALPARTRADHKILFSCGDWSDELLHELRAIAPIAIEENDDLRLRRESADARRAGAAVTGRRL